MISVGNYKAVICKGDFHPAELYKGDKKIAGFAKTSFSTKGGVSLTSCYNDRLHNAKITGNSVQNAAPTPQNPIEVQSVGELVTQGDYAGKYKIGVTAHGESGKSESFDIYLDEPLRKVGDYADYIDFENGKVVRNVGKTVYTGNENWLEHDTKNLFHYQSVSSVLYNSSIVDMVRSSRLPSQVWANLFQNINRADGSLLVGTSCVYNESAKLRYIYVCPYSKEKTVAEWQALLRTWYKEGNPFTVWYAIPTTQKVIELPKLPTFKGTTIYEIDTQITATISGNYKKTE